MKILVIGSGAREDALSWRLAQSPSCSAIVAAPGNAGTAMRGDNWPIAATDGRALAERAVAERIDLAVIGPDAAIAAGVADKLRAAGITTFGPNRSAGRLESSKSFAKRFMQAHGIPTATADIVHNVDQATRALRRRSGGVVVKADGLAAGKGVVVCDSAVDAEAVVRDWYENARIPGGGSDILLEERLAGPEVSVFALCDGERIVPFAAACDYKRALDGDRGPNTGGMGAYSPPAGFPAGMLDVVAERIIEPVRRGLSADGERYVGVLYCGLMWTATGPVVIEFNARFGDPETQALMPLVEGDFAQLLAATAHGRLDPAAVSVARDACVAVVLATSDYPVASAPLAGLPAALDLPPGCVGFWGTSTLGAGTVDAAGGRVLTIAARAADVGSARTAAYAGAAAAAARIGVERVRFRRDVAALSGSAALA